MINKDEQEVIRKEVSDAMAASMEMFGFHELIDECDGITDEQKRWAKSNLDWRVVVR